MAEKLENLVRFKVDGTSFPDAGSLVTTAHVMCEICPRDLKYRESKTNRAVQKLLHTRCLFSCLSEIGSKQKLSFGRQLLSNSVCIRKTLFVAQCPKFKARVSISSVAINLVGVYKDVLKSKYFSIYFMLVAFMSPVKFSNLFFRCEISCEV